MNKRDIVKECPENIYKVRKNTAYGTLSHQTYHSTTTGLDRGVNILLPPGYDSSVKYPVLYLLHGIFGDEYTMCGDQGNALLEIAANLACDGEAEDMVIVLPNMYASSDPNQKPGFNKKDIEPYDDFINDLVNDLIPFVERSYSVLTDRKSRALAGFSMGGRETLFIGFNRPDLFAYVGAIAPAPGLVPAKDWAMIHEGQMEESAMTFAAGENEPDVLMICCGTQDKTVGNFPKSYHEILEKNGVDHIWYEVPGADHDSNAIKSGLYNFMRNIFG